MVLLKDVLTDLKKEFDFTLLIIGDAEFKMEGIDVIALPWKGETEVTDLLKMDIGLYPLPDEPWVYGKSGLKALQYMALGTPTIAAAIGANFRIIQNGKNGFLVKTDEEWKNALRELITSEDLRKRMGTAGRKTVVDYFSLHANKKKYIEVLMK